MHGGTMIVKLQRKPDHVIALTRQHRGNNGGIDAAGHGNDNPVILRPAGKFETVHASKSRLLALLVLSNDFLHMMRVLFTGRR
jgi:hypothetical protein